MGTKEQYEHEREIRERTIQQKLSPQQYEFSHVPIEDNQTIAIDDYCSKCGDVTPHELYARSLSHEGNTKCLQCGNIQRA